MLSVLEGCIIFSSNTKSRTGKRDKFIDKVNEQPEKPIERIEYAKLLANIMDYKKD